MLNSFSSKNAVIAAALCLSLAQAIAGSSDSKPSKIFAFFHKKEAPHQDLYRVMNIPAVRLLALAPEFNTTAIMTGRSNGSTIKFDETSHASLMLAHRPRLCSDHTIPELGCPVTLIRRSTEQWAIRCNYHNLYHLITLVDQPQQ